MCEFKETSENMKLWVHGVCLYVANNETLSKGKRDLDTLIIS